LVTWDELRQDAGQGFRRKAEHALVFAMTLAAAFHTWAAPPPIVTTVATTTVSMPAAGCVEAHEDLSRSAYTVAKVSCMALSFRCLAKVALHFVNRQSLTRTVSAMTMHSPLPVDEGTKKPLLSPI